MKAIGFVLSKQQAASQGGFLDEEKEGAGRVLFDVTGILHWYAFLDHPSGIQRIAEKLISCSGLCANPRVEFVVRALGSETFCTIDRHLLAKLDEPEHRREAIARLRALFAHSMRLAPLRRLLADARYYHMTYILLGLMRLDRVVEWRWSRRWPRSTTLLEPVQPPGPADVLFNLGDLWWQRNYVSALLGFQERTGIRLVQMIHDLFIIERPEWFMPGFVRVFEGEFEKLAPRVERWITNSRFVAGQLARHLERRSLSPRPIAVLPMGWDSFAHLEGGPNHRDEDILRRYGLRGQAYILFVGTVEPRKNLGTLLDALELLRSEAGPLVPELVVVGGGGWRSRTVRARLRSDRFVHWFQAVPDADLAAIYRGARFTVAPSFTEGWGLPVQESIAHGVPCIASSAGALPESSAGLAVFFDPANTEELKNAMARWVTDERALAAARAAIASALPATERPTWQDAGKVLLRHAFS